jgi:hypothetical protein
MSIVNVLRGADPELFLRSAIDNSPVVSIGQIGGSKTFPRSIGNGFALQEDNVAVEFNIPPADSKEKFNASIQFVLEHLKQELSPKGLVLDISATMDFDIEQLAHPQAQELGCEPDYNAWTNRVNPRPKAPETLRSSGGHLHIGYANPDVEVSRNIIKAHDLFCGVASLVYDNDTRRRAIYGKAGAHRIKGYGVEYRTLSNFWIKSPELTDWVYEQSEKAIDFLNKGNRISLKWGRDIVNCINNGDMDLLAKIDRQFSIL